MRLLSVFFLLYSGSTAFGQAPLANAKPDQSPAAQQTTPNSDDQGTAQDSAQRSALEVRPGSPAIKQKDLWDGTGYWHPFVRMPKYILQDQKAIWTSPFHISKKDAKLWAIFGTITVALVATDKWTVKQLPNSSSQVSVSTWASRFGAAYT